MTSVQKKIKEPYYVVQLIYNEIKINLQKIKYDIIK